MPVLRSGGFVLESGSELTELDIAYETYGTLSPAADNAILVFHGLTSSHIAAGDVTPDKRRGWWDSVIGPGKVFDTDRYFIVSSNMLGSCYGTTGPASRDPATGFPYGPDFPAISFRDIVKAQKRLVDSLGIGTLLAVAGSSFGGYLAFQWAVTCPEAMRAVIALDTAARDIFDSAAVAHDLRVEFEAQPGWHGGRYQGSAGLAAHLTELRVRTLKSYGFEEQLDPALSAEARAATIESLARDWAREFDPMSLVRLWEATAGFDAEAEFAAIQAPVLYILCDNDSWFPASLGRDVTAKLAAAGVDAQFLEIASRHGHYASTEEPHLWSATARAFLDAAASR